MRILQSLIQFGRQAARRAEGAVAVQFAVLVLPLTTLALGLVDLNRASTQHNQLQDALDAATLITARSNAVTPQAIQSTGAAALSAQLAGMHDATLQSANFTAQGNTIVASASLTVSPIVANLWLNGDMQVTANSEVMRSINKVEVVMVLDNTGSMAANSKLTNLKTAASTLVDTLSSAAARSADPNAVKIGMVPFSMTVRIGTPTETAGYQSAYWMDPTAISPINNQIFTTAAGTQAANRYTLLKTMGKTWGGCVESRVQPYDVQDTAPNTAVPATLFTPYFWPDEPDGQATNKNGNFGSFYNNYLTDGTYSATNWLIPQGAITKYKPNSVKTGVNSTTGYTYGPNAGCAVEPISRLTQNWTALKTSINNMVATGETHIPLGLVWGWHVLSPNAPFADGVPYGTPKTTKIVILMTDGDNTYGVDKNSNTSNYDSYGYVWQNRLGIASGTGPQRTTALDNRLKLLCDNMKGQQIVIYTVGVMVSTSSKTLLTYCASGSDHYYDVTNSADINTAFSAIAGLIQNLRISK